jgi:hypothetical protein
MSTTSAALKIFDCIVSGLDDKCKMAGIFCDLPKAFDVINHELLLDKLHHYGIRNLAHSLVTSFLSDRRQVVKLSASGKRLKSSAGSVNIGIPQGSALGNTLFLTFMNDLPAAITAGLSVLFADDTTVVVCARTYEQLGEKIHDGCDQLHRWFSTNGLVLNMSKSNVMVFSGRKITIPPCVANGPMPVSDECRFLGFTLDSNLNWKCHVDKLCDRLSSAVFALRKLKPIISDDALKQVYFAYFHSLMSYGTLIWGNSTDANRVLLMQKRAIRALIGAKSRTSCRDHFLAHGIMTHYSLYVFEIIMFVRNNLSDFNKVNAIGKTLRRTGRLRTVPRRMALARKNPRVIGPTYYERLPADLRLEKSDEAFRRRLKRLLLKNPLYSVKEYMDLDLDCK